MATSSTIHWAVVIAGAFRRSNRASRRLLTLPQVFVGIAERAEHLHNFVSGYAACAKLPAPPPERIEWRSFVADLMSQQVFTLAAPLPVPPGWFDPGQVE